jgi:hypothetical protein
MSLTKASYSMITGTPVNVLDYMTPAQVTDVTSNTGSIDVTSAISAAIADLGNVGTSTGGGVLYFPKGTYLCNVSLVGTTNNSLGEYGICLSGYGATLVGRSTDTSIITINNAVANQTDPNPGGNIYVNGLRIEGFTLNMKNMTNSAASYAVAGLHTYNSTVCDIHVIYEPGLGGGFFLGSQCYTWDVINLNCARVQIAGYNNSTNTSSSMTFNGLVANQVILTNVFAISFFGGVIQGTQDHFIMNGAQAITVTGMDLEGGGSAYCYNFGSNCRYVTSFGNTAGGFNTNNYSTGFAPNSFLEDRPNISGISGLGVYGKSSSQGLVSVATTSATAIYNFLDVPSGQACGLFMVAGDNGSNGFQDLIMVFNTTISVVSSNGTYGSPPTRTYTSASNVLNVTLSSVSGGGYQIRPVALEFLFSSL